MKTLYHPTLGTPVDVLDGDVEAWVEQGWRKTPPTGADPAPAKRATARRRPRKTTTPEPAAPAGDSPVS